MNKKIGFIGSGNMARAMIHGILSSGFFGAEQMIASARSQETLAKNQSRVWHRNDVGKHKSYRAIEHCCACGQAVSL